jgi:hypothetical protein
MAVPDLISNNSWAVVHTCHSSNCEKLKIGGSLSRATWAKCKNSISKIIRAKRVAQVVNGLTNKKPLSSTPVSPKKKKKKKN